MQTIEAITIYPFPVRMRAPFRIATMVADSAANVLVAVRASGGLTGWGEASPLHSITGETANIVIASLRELRPLVIGREALEIEAIAHDLDRFLPHNSTAKSAIDMALHDIAAQAAGLPLYRLLGGRSRPMETDITLGIGDPAAAGDEALALLRHGPRILKVKLGTTLCEDAIRLNSIRRTVGSDVPIRIDANQGYSRTEALAAMRDFEQYDIQFCEQPVRAHETAALRALSTVSPIPIMADEAISNPADALRLAAGDCAPLFNVKLSKAGGIGPARRIAAIAEAAGIRCMVGCMLETRLGLTAAAHFAAAAENIDWFDLDTSFEQSEDPVEGGIRFDGGAIVLPEAAGLGAAPSADTLRRLEAVD